MTPEQHANIKQLFLRACELPQDERSAYLEKECKGDDRLRGEIEILFAHHRPEDSNAKQDTVAAEMRQAGFPTAESDRVDTSEPDDHSVDGAPPGEIIADRYRIVTQLGRGGMGVVYRADDLELSQTVAIKFLPPQFAQDPVWSARLQQEVRLAREVTHPNVCRIHDIAKADGLHFITMEYIDGENLGALLQRIGRLPSDKAVDIARQLCAGLAAAHARGVLHRDLKPANVMLDGRGRVKITDFGLAGLAGRIPGAEIRAGTPRYMAPEQIAGIEVTQKSDLYSLGLVLYELYTGRPAFVGKTLAEYQALHESSHPEPPSSILPYIDPDVERIILVCLRKNPADRPESALAVAAALPGGDLLAAALAAGETPSPEMVAASGSHLRTKSPAIIAALVSFVVLFVAAYSLNYKRYPSSLAAFEKSPEVLADRARQLARGVSSADRPKDFSYRFVGDLDCNLAFDSTNGNRPNQLKLAARNREPVAFWYRQRDGDYLVPANVENVLFSGARVTGEDPPRQNAGDSTIVLDGGGHLLFLQAQPRAGDEDAATSTPDWDRFFEAAQIDPSQLSESRSCLIPDFPTDSQRAWLGTNPENPTHSIRIEAASFRGRPVLFTVLAQDDDVSNKVFLHPERKRRIVRVARDLMLFFLVVIAIPLARHNLRLGKSDRKGALRIGCFVGLLKLLSWLLSAHHVPLPMIELRLLAFAAMAALGEGFVVWLFYSAMEPYVRKFWPQTIIAWARLSMGRLRDHYVGSQMLIGSVIGVLWCVFISLDSRAPAWLGLSSEGQSRLLEDYSHLLGGRYAVAHCIDTLRSSVYQGLLLLLVLVALRALVRRTWLAALLGILLICPMFVPLGSHPAVSWPLIGGGCVAAAVWAFTRFGLVCVVTALFSAKILLAFPMTLDLTRWYFDLSLFAAAVVVAVAAFGFLQAATKGPLDRVTAHS